MFRNWSTWEDLGKPAEMSKIGHDEAFITAMRNQEGRQEVFVKISDNDQIWRIWQTAPNGKWSDWSSLGNPPGGFPAIQDRPTTPFVVGQNQDGRLELFYIGKEELWHIWQKAPNGEWSDWSSLGNPGSHNAPLSNVAVGQNQDGRLEVFAPRFPELWHIWQTASNNGWSDWKSLGAPSNSVSGSPSLVVVGQNQDGRLEAFVRGSDNLVYNIWQTAPNLGWSKWGSLKKPPREFFFQLWSLAVGRNQDGRLEIFAIDPAGPSDLWNNWQTAPNNGWSGWHNSLHQPPDLGHFAISQNMIIQNQDGRLEVFMEDINRNLYHTYQTAPNNGWSEWSSLGRPLYTDDSVGAANISLGTGMNQDGRLEVFAIHMGSLWHIWQG